jgi:ketosteroid isomerase-like protein
MSSTQDTPRDANLRVMQRYAAAWLAGDRATLVDCYHDDFTLHYFGANALAGIHAGKPAALAALAELRRRASRRLVAILDVMAGSERTSVVVREHFARDGREAEVERLLVYTIKDDRLHHCWVYDQDQTLIDTFLAD